MRDRPPTPPIPDLVPIRIELPVRGTRCEVPQPFNDERIVR